jgi:hypothetical protein
MPKRKLPKNYKESTFFTMKANPEGASIGNFVNNMKRIPRAFSEVGTAIINNNTPARRKHRRNAMPMNYKNPKYKPSSGIGVGY